jgi:hypothetical protein
MDMKRRKVWRMTWEMTTTTMMALKRITLGMIRIIWIVVDVVGGMRLEEVLVVVGVVGVVVVEVEVGVAGLRPRRLGNVGVVVVGKRVGAERAAKGVGKRRIPPMRGYLTWTIFRLMELLLRWL